MRIFFYYFELFREISKYSGWKMIFSNFLYQSGDLNDRDLFSNFKLFHVGKIY